MLQCFVGDFGERSREFQPCRARANNHKRKPRTGFRLARRAFRTFERQQNFLPDVGRFLNRFQAGSIFPPGIIAIVRSLRAGGDNQRVIFELRAVVQPKEIFVGGNVRGFAQQYFGVFLFAQHAAQRRRYFTRRKRTGSHLVQKRLKQMKVAPIQ